jgi:hypothetical protein
VIAAMYLLIVILLPVTFFAVYYPRRYNGFGGER